MTGATTRKTWFMRPPRCARSERPVPLDALASMATFALALVPVFALGLALPAGCGNYSNEDLEFMSAIPQRDDMAIEVPRRGNLVMANTADGWRTTVEVTRGFNGAADAFLSLIEKVRSYYPTSRNANERIWGPFPSDENPGWQVEFHMLKRLDLPMLRFEYQLVMIPPAGVILPSGQPVTQIIGGFFDAAGGVRIGAGHLAVTLNEARAAEVMFPKLEKLRELTVDYQTRVWPRRVEMTIKNSADDPTAEPVGATYVYERAQNGDGAMTFSVPENVVDSGPALENLMVESRWLGTGEGRADVTVTGGDTPGGTATSLECWGEDFVETYLSQSWNPPPTGDSGSCISKL